MKKNIGTLLLSLFLLSACTSSPADGVAYILGNDDAKVTIQEFSDLECPACGFISPMVSAFVRANPTLARLEFYHYPLSYHEFAFIGAESAECAGEQGKFFEYIDTVYANQDSLSEDYLKNVAEGLELNMDDFNVCVDEHRYKSKILSHMAEGSRMGLRGTPSLYINGQLIQWAGDEAMKEYLESL